MAGGRKRGGNKAKAKSQLSLGDLVLAKVKGFPAWPAKISRPEDWDRAPDPKKYFVQFFGTQEIAFVTPADIQAFTSESKSKLLARCQGKTVKYFAQAVKEISEAFDELQKEKSSESRDDTDRSVLGCEVPSIDGEDIDLKNRKCAVIPNGETISGDIGDFGSKLEPCSNSRGETDSEYIKRSISCHADNILSPVLSSEKNFKGSIEPQSKEASSDNKEDNNNHLYKGQKGFPNGQKLEKMASGSKRAFEGSVGGQKSNLDVTLLKDDSPGQCVDFSDSSEQHKDILDGKIASNGSISEISMDALGSDSDIGSGKNIDVRRVKRSFKGSDDAEDTIANSKCEVSGVKKIAQAVTAGKLRSGMNGILNPVKKSKCVDLKDDATKVSISKSMKSGLSSSKIVDSKMVEYSVSKHSTSHVKREMVLALKAQSVKRNVGSDVSGDEAVLPLTKRHKWALEAMSDSATLKSDDKAKKISVEVKNDMPCSDNVRPLVPPLPKRRRAVCLFDDEPKTPVHGGSARNVKALPSVSGRHLESSDNAKKSDSARDSTGFEYSILKETSSQSRNETVSPSQLANGERRPASHVGSSAGKSESEQQLSSKEAKTVLVSPTKSHLASAGEQHKSSKSFFSKGPSAVSLKKLQAMSGKGSGLVSDSTNSSEDHVSSQRNKSASSGERLKTTAKAASHINDRAVLTDTSLEKCYLPSEILEARNSSLNDSKSLDSAVSMKHLIAAAQAKRKQAHLQQFSFGNPNAGFSFVADVQGNSASPSDVQSFLSGTGNMVQADIHGLNNRPNLVSPSTHGHQSVTRCQLDTEEVEERRVNSGHRAGGGSLSGGTEAAVARDAFEGMIETLSRTRESIGRATRLAIDCAKYGLANEVVELLIHKLESEPSFHRKVDLFFLVDSITQCSHNQKGVVGVSYVPTVQAALPRLLGAAAPAGAGVRENRRQCLKVLRLWLERKIFPDSFLRRYMDDIGGSNDETSSGFSLRRPARSERAIDDPIREMEGMHVDEYGSNATFQLPGLLSSHVFEDEEEELPSSTYNAAAHASPVEQTRASGESETCPVTPNDRRHCILEDVDGELEMEDVSGHQKDESGSFETDPQRMDSDRTLEPASNNFSELPPLPEGSPPLPPDSPPPMPPLPPSPPPQLPSSPSPPPPPPPVSSLPPLPPPPLGPPPPLVSSIVQSQPSLVTQPLLPPHSSVQSSPQLAYQPPVLREYYNKPSGNQIVQMAGNNLGGHIDAAAKSEMFPQQSPCFVPTGMGNSREPSGFNNPSRQLEYGHNEMYLNPQASQPNQQFQQGNAPFVQRAMHPGLAQVPSNHFSFPKPPTEQHPHQHFPHPYALPSHPDIQRRFVTDEQWRMSSGEFSTDSQQGVWMGGRRTPPQSGLPFAQEGYFRAPVERQPTNNMGFQNNNLPTPQIPGHGVSQMLPCRPDVSAVNCWRPA